MTPTLCSHGVDREPVKSKSLSESRMHAKIPPRKLHFIYRAADKACFDMSSQHGELHPVEGSLLPRLVMHQTYSWVFYQNRHHAGSGQIVGTEEILTLKKSA